MDAPASKQKRAFLKGMALPTIAEILQWQHHTLF